MFTGLVENVGEVAAITPIGGERALIIREPMPGSSAQGGMSPHLSTSSRLCPPSSSTAATPCVGATL